MFAKRFDLPYAKKFKMFLHNGDKLFLFHFCCKEVSLQWFLSGVNAVYFWLYL